MSIFDKVTLDDPRPLPVILLVDTSDSMSEENRIGVCNESIRSMLREFAQLDRTTGAIQIAVITFGGQARIHQPLTPVRQIEWTDMEPSGLTPIGGALRLAGQILEDREQVPTRAYEPTLVLVSDGLPTDDYEDELLTFEAARRASRAHRLAVSVNMAETHPGYQTLLQFVGAKPDQIYLAENASDIVEALRWVTWSVTARSKSADPDNDYPIIGAPDF